MAMGRRQKAGKRRRQVKDSFKNTTLWVLKFHRNLCSYLVLYLYKNGGLDLVLTKNISKDCTFNLLFCRKVIIYQHPCNFFSFCRYLILTSNSSLRVPRASINTEMN